MSSDDVFLGLFEDDGGSVHLTVEEIHDLCKAPACWFRFVAMLRGGPPALMVLNAAGREAARMKVVRESRALPANATFSTI